MKKPVKKPAKKQRPLVTEPMLLVFKEKHGDRHYHTPNDKTLFRVALAVLTERWEEGCWYYGPDEEAPVAPDVEEKDIPTLPRSLQIEATAKIRDYHRQKSEWDDLTREYEDIQVAVKTEDGRLAWRILRDRSSAEYEGVRLERYDEVP
jgi:hypothetical protein